MKRSVTERGRERGRRKEGVNEAGREGVQGESVTWRRETRLAPCWGDQSEPGSCTPNACLL